jgi:hypothetical protein
LPHGTTDAINVPLRAFAGNSGYFASPMAIKKRTQVLEWIILRLWPAFTVQFQNIDIVSTAHMQIRHYGYLPDLLFPAFGIMRRGSSGS